MTGPKSIESLCQPWKREPFIDRISKCKAMLCIHGFLTDAESARVHKRMMKRIDNEKKAGAT